MPRSYLKFLYSSLINYINKMVEWREKKNKNVKLLYIIIQRLDHYVITSKRQPIV